MRTMILEGDADARCLFRYLLRDMGYESRELLTTQDLQSVLKDGYLPDLLLLEITPYQATRWELIRKLHSIPVWRHIPVIVITTINNEETLRKGWEVGAAGVLFEPFDVETFQHCITSVLQNWVNLGMENTARATEGSM